MKNVLWWTVGDALAVLVCALLAYISYMRGDVLLSGAAISLGLFCFTSVAGYPLGYGLAENSLRGTLICVAVCTGLASLAWLGTILREIILCSRGSSFPTPLGGWLFLILGSLMTLGGSMQWAASQFKEEGEKKSPSRRKKRRRE